MIADLIEGEGFATVHDVLAPAECARLVDALDGQNSLRSRAGMRNAMRQPNLRAVAGDPRILDIVRGVLGSGAMPFHATLFDKSPTSNWLVAWHQDTAPPMRAKREAEGWGPWSVKQGVIYARAPAATLAEILALRIHLDDSASENGPLKVLPGTHRYGILDDDIHRMAREISAVECLVPRGGVLALKPLLVHASSKSFSQMSRRVLHIEYAPSAAFVQRIGLAVA